jgi:hypothetical protein
MSGVGEKKGRTAGEGGGEGGGGEKPAEKRARIDEEEQCALCFKSPEVKRAP